ncbi:orotidine-5'-phosphate decarboxylase [Shuttleworthella satelles]|nr:orotidine-5'-phosphate decarboxylase [Shuttleworthia satelles]
MIKRLIREIQKKNAPIVVGLDPQMALIPQKLLDKNYQQYGQTLEGAANAFWDFNRAIIDAVCDLIPAVKPQSAMYERLGLAGEAVYHKTISYARDKGLLVIGDIKRGDIGSTSAAYADGHLGLVTVGEKVYAPFGEDFATVNPYMGTDAVGPFVDVCKAQDKGIFVLVKTSNPSSGEFQDQILAETGKPLYESVAYMVEKWGEETREDGYSDVGAVVGATYPRQGERLRELMPHTYILVPGYGAQGGRGFDLTHFFDKDGLGAIVNSSRGIIAAYQKDNYAGFGAEHFAEASRQAVLDMLADINGALGR